MRHAREVDAERLGVLRATGLLEAGRSPSLDRLTGLAARVVGAPVALVSLVDADRQRFASACGLDGELDATRETPLTHSFCRRVVEDRRPLIVEDARADERLRANPAVAEYTAIAYAGFPLRSPDGHVLGSFCVVDTRPRRWTEDELATLADLAPHISKAYADIAPTNNDAIAEYRASADLDVPRQVEHDTARADLSAALESAMAERRAEEIQRGVSLVGPHRDDIALSLGMLPAKGYASHGESWSFALALRLGSFHLLRADGVEPVLVLDDVFAELDSIRRERLASGVRVAEQVLVTAAVGADVPELLAGQRFRVAGGDVTLDD